MTKSRYCNEHRRHSERVRLIDMSGEIIFALIAAVALVSIVVSILVYAPSSVRLTLTPDLAPNCTIALRKWFHDACDAANGILKNTHFEPSIYGWDRTNSAVTGMFIAASLYPIIIVAITAAISIMCAARIKKYKRIWQNRIWPFSAYCLAGIFIYLAVANFYAETLVNVSQSDLPSFPQIESLVWAIAIMSLIKAVGVIIAVAASMLIVRRFIERIREI